MLNISNALLTKYVLGLIKTLMHQLHQRTLYICNVLLLSYITIIFLTITLILNTSKQINSGTTFTLISSQKCIRS